MSSCPVLLMYSLLAEWSSMSRFSSCGHIIIQCWRQTQASDTRTNDEDRHKPQTPGPMLKTDTNLRHQDKCWRQTDTGLRHQDKCWRQTDTGLRHQDKCWRQTDTSLRHQDKCWRQTQASDTRTSAEDRQTQTSDTRTNAEDRHKPQTPGQVLKTDRHKPQTPGPMLKTDTSLRHQYKCWRQTQALDARTSAEDRHKP